MRNWLRAMLAGAALWWTAGAQAQVFLSADEQWMDYLAERRLLAAGEEIDQVLLRLDRRRRALARIRHSSLLQRARPDRPRLRILADAA